MATKKKEAAAPAKEEKKSGPSLEKRARALLPDLDGSEDFAEAKLAQAIRTAFPDPWVQGEVS